MFCRGSQVLPVRSCPALPTRRLAGQRRHGPAPRSRLLGSAMAALRGAARLARQPVQAVRHVNDELLRTSEAISLRRTPEPRRQPQRPSSDTDPNPASESTEPAKRAA